jgi:glycosyl transferase family 25
MTNPFNFFDKVYVISAKDNHERRAYMEKVLSDLDVQFKFFDAVMGKNLSNAEIDKVYDEEGAKNYKTSRRRLSKAEIGCALSHISIYKKIIEENLNNALIFEDDIITNDTHLVDLSDALKELPPDWDLIHFGTLDHYLKAPLSFKLKTKLYYPLIRIFKPDKFYFKNVNLRNLYPRPYSKFLKRPGFHRGCHAYAMSRKGAQKFIDYHDKVLSPADHLISVMCVENELNAFMTRDLMFEQNEEFESALEESRLSIRENLRE